MASSTAKIIAFAELALTFIGGIVFGKNTPVGQYSNFNWTAMLVFWLGGLLLFAFLMIGAGILDQLEETNAYLAYFWEKDKKAELDEFHNKRK